MCAAHTACDAIAAANALLSAAYPEAATAAIAEAQNDPEQEGSEPLLEPPPDVAPGPDDGTTADADERGRPKLGMVPESQEHDMWGGFRPPVPVAAVASHAEAEQPAQRSAHAPTPPHEDRPFGGSPVREEHASDFASGEISLTFDLQDRAETIAEEPAVVHQVGSSFQLEQLQFSGHFFSGLYRTFCATGDPSIRYAKA